MYVYFNVNANCLHLLAQEQSPKKSARRKVTLQTLKRLHGAGTPITFLTAHDYGSGLVCERAGVDAVLVGDSLGMVALGHATTQRVTMDEMLHHCRAVARAVKTPLLVGDMPFGSYEADEREAVRNAIRLMKEGRVDVSA